MTILLLKVLHRRFPRIGSGRGPGGRRFFFWRTLLKTYTAISPATTRLSTCLVSSSSKAMLDFQSASHGTLESEQLIICNLMKSAGVFDWGISESNFWPRPLRIRACVISTSSCQSNANEWKRSVYKMAGEIQNWRGVKSKLSVVGLLIEIMSDGDDESEEYNDDSLLMEVAVFR